MGDRCSLASVLLLAMSCFCIRTGTIWGQWDMEVATNNVGLFLVFHVQLQFSTEKKSHVNPVTSFFVLQCFFF